MLTPKDIEDNTRASGYRHVVKRGDDAVSPYVANVYGGDKDKSGRRWQGPRRKTALEAAKDYCDYANGQGVTPVTLASAGHKRKKRPRLPNDPEVMAALGVIKDARGAQAGNQGYVYLITDQTAYKVGYSTNPEARVPELQTGNPRPLELLAYFPGTVEDERLTQQQFIDHNILQEWFRPMAEVAFYFYDREDVVRP